MLLMTTLANCWGSSCRWCHSHQSKIFRENATDKEGNMMVDFGCDKWDVSVRIDGFHEWDKDGLDKPGVAGKGDDLEGLGAHTLQTVLKLHIILELSVPWLVGGSSAYSGDRDKGVHTLAKTDLAFLHLAHSMWYEVVQLMRKAHSSRCLQVSTEVEGS
ncbi:hypothetical protein EDD16DRAFT_1519816 [Pisolithus croceorrhizus]|nr:hypothetical protein EDD16DRAFT_1519816 [Pisolithus croceorrhizus]